MDNFFADNGIDDTSKKRSAFLAMIGPAMYDLQRNLVSPDKSEDKYYDQLVFVLNDHYNPTHRRWSGAPCFSGGSRNFERGVQQVGWHIHSAPPKAGRRVAKWRSVRAKRGNFFRRVLFSDQEALL